VLRQQSRNKILGIIKRTVISRDKDIILRFYKSLVRPHLEYCVQAWCPHFRKDIDVLKKMQRRATKMTRGFKGLSYEERLSECGITTLEKRRIRGDLIETFKIIKGTEVVSCDRFFTRDMSRRTRGHEYKLYKPIGWGNSRHIFFSNRVKDIWNGLNSETVSIVTVNSFEKGLGRLGY
jgi:hypothetical protein